MAGDGIFARTECDDGVAVCRYCSDFFAINPDTFGVVAGDMYFGATAGRDGHVELEQISLDFPARFVGTEL